MSLNGAANSANAATAAAVSDTAADLVRQGLLQNAGQPAQAGEPQTALTLNSPNLSPEQKAEIRRMMYATIYEWRRQKAERAEKRWTKRGLCAAGGYLFGRLLVRADKEKTAQPVSSPDVFEEIARPVSDELCRQCNRQEQRTERTEDHRRRRRWQHRSLWRDRRQQRRLAYAACHSRLLPPPV
ncbi:MAG: hypothetical protein ABSE73_01400 [Planctomycetota bacterium]